jgi:rRNA maturation protein Nop10
LRKIRNFWIDSRRSGAQNEAMKPWRVLRKNVIGLKFACPDCGQHVDAGRELFGEIVECPICGKLMQVPDLKNAPGDFSPRRLPPPPRGGA